MPTPTVLPPIPAFAQRPNLLRHALTPAGGDERWLNGGTWQPELCVGGGTYPGICDPADVDLTVSNPAQENPVTESYMIWTGERCSTLGTDPTELRARAERQLAAQESHLVEQALWTGVTQQGTATMQGLVDGPDDPLAGAPVGVVTGIGVLLRHIADTIGGARAMIHAPIELEPFFAFYGQAVRSGDSTVLALGDHPVVFGTGYSGTGPADAEPAAGIKWVYATGMVEVRLGAVQVTPPSLAEAVDRTTNLIEYRVERPALHRFDPCLHVGVPICLPDPGPECDQAEVSPLSAGWDVGEWDSDIWV